jgi:hypothetical protein
MAWTDLSGAYATGIVLAVSSLAVVTVALTAAALVAAAFYSLVKVQGERIEATTKAEGERIDDARADFTANFERLDGHIGERLTEQATRLEQRIDAVGERLESKIDALGERLDRVEDRTAS